MSCRVSTLIEGYHQAQWEVDSQSMHLDSHPIACKHPSVVYQGRE